MELVVELGVAGKSRPRFNSKTGGVYMPSSYLASRKGVEWLLSQALSGRPGFFSASRLYSIWAISFMRRPKARNKKEAALMAELFPDGYHVDGKPDVDNFVGTLMDAAERLVYENDSQVVDSRAERRIFSSAAAYMRIRKHTSETFRAALDLRKANGHVGSFQKPG